MSYGLHVINGNKRIQIDETYQNFFLAEEGSVVMYNNGSAYYTYVAFSTPVESLPLFAVSTDASISNGVGISSYVKSGGKFVGVNLITGRLSTAVTVRWKLFTTQRVRSSEAYGIRTYDQRGNIIFDGGKTQMIIREALNINLGSGSGVTVNHGTYTDAFYILSATGFAFQIVPQGPQSVLLHFKAMIKKINASSCSVGYALYYAQNAGGGGASEPFTKTTGLFKLLVCEIK